MKYLNSAALFLVRRFCVVRKVLCLKVPHDAIQRCVWLLYVYKIPHPSKWENVAVTKKLLYSRNTSW